MEDITVMRGIGQDLSTLCVRMEMILNEASVGKQGAKMGGQMQDGSGY